MGTMNMISSYRTRQQMADDLDSKGRRRNGDYTRVADVPLREVARSQANTLRAVGSTGNRAAKLAEMQAKVDEVRAMQHAPAPVARPAVATVERPDFKTLDALAASIPVGMYALPRREDATTGKQPIYFFKVHKFRGGHRIVMVTGGVGDFTEVPMKVKWQLRALEGIAADVAGAAARFGHEVAECGFCAAKGRRSPLTHERSRKAGFGKVCAEKNGLTW